MKMSVRPIAAVVVGAALMTGVAGCGAIDNIDPSNLPNFSRSPAPTESSAPAPTETVTSDPEPQPIVTEESKPQVTVTAQPEPEPEPTLSSDAPATNESSIQWWAWAILGVIVLILLILMVRGRANRRAWQNRLDRAKSELSWLEDSLIPQVLSKPTAAEASSLWQAARPRLLDLDRELHELADSGADAAHTNSAARGLHALQALTTAMDAETSTHEGGDADALRARRANVENARANARVWITPPMR